MDVARGAIRRRPFVVVEKIDPDDVAVNVVPERRGVFETGVDEFQPLAGIHRALALSPGLEERGRHQQGDEDGS